MKKLIILAVSVCLVLLAVFSLASCEQNDTLTPANVRIDYDTLTLKWSKVPGARSYEIIVEGEEKTKTTLKNQFSLEYLEPGEYVVSVRAINGDPNLSPSEWVAKEFTREKESGLKYTLINNKTEYELVGAGTAYGDVVMESVYRGKPVTSIASKAFQNNRKITSFVVGDYVTSIGSFAFHKCDSLVSVTIKDSVKSIGSNAFQSCKALTEVSIPSTVTAIAPYTFSYCSELLAVKNASGVQTIGEYAFSNCTNLQSVDFSASIESVDQYAFADCTSLTSIELPGAKKLASYSFLNCSAVETLNLGTKLESIGVGAFTGLVKITKVVIPDSATSIGESSFAMCELLDDITIGSGVTSIGPYAFYGTKLYNDAEGIVYIGGWAIFAKNRDLASITPKANTALREGTYAIADAAFIELQNLSVVELSGIKYIGKQAFAKCPKFYQFISDGALESIGDAAFYSDIMLYSVTVGGSLKKIGNNAFQDCATLLNMDLPDSLTEIGSYAFRNTLAHKLASDIVYIDNWAVDHVEKTYFQHIGLREDTVGIADYTFYKISIMGVGFALNENLKYIGKGAFYNCGYATAITLMDAVNLEYIGDYAFYGCTGAWFGEKGKTTIPSSVKHIGRSAFYNCSTMISLEIPEGVETIGDYAFYGCKNLGNGGEIWESIEDMKEGKPSMVGTVTIAYGVKHIGNRAFQGCTGIENITIPGSVVTMGERVFYKCAKLETVVLGEGLLHIPAYTFYKCTNLTDVSFSNSIKTIANYAFKDCTSLDKLIIGNDVEFIGDYAFYGCVGISDITLPGKLVSIGKYAFKGCNSVDSVILASNIQVIGKHAFYGMKNATFFCESESIPALWNERWNSSYCPVFWGCDLSADKTEVVSFTKTETSLDNIEGTNAKLSPEKTDLYFIGWDTDASASTVVFSAKDIENVEDGTTLYPVWTDVAPDIAPLPEEQPELGGDISGTEQ